MNFYEIGQFWPKVKKITKFSKFSFWKSPISWPQISFTLHPTPSKWSSLCSRKPGDSFRYLQSSFWMAISCREAQKRILIKYKDFDQNWQKSQNFQNFHFEKVRFPASKSRSNCFLHLWNEVSVAQGSLEIVLDTYKVRFGWLEAAVKLKSEFLWNWSILTKIWQNEKIQIFILKKSDFLNSNLVQIVSHTFEMKLALLQKAWRWF